MGKYLKNISCGESMPFNNPHAVSVSLPTINDVVGYEEGDVKIIVKMKSGYPRFFRNFFVEKLVDFIIKRYRISKDYFIIPINSFKAYTIICELINNEIEFVELDGLYFLLVHFDNKDLEKINKYVQHAGLIISSRRAEKTLIKYKIINAKYFEKKLDFIEAINSITNEITEAYGVAEENIVLTNNGANAVFSICEYIFKEGYYHKRGVVQLGWLYVDTSDVIKKRAKYFYQHLDVYDLNGLEFFLKNNHQKIGMLITEAVTNPKLECVDVKKVYQLCKKYNVLCVLDVTLITPYNFNVLEYCDVAVESLSKFACGHADLLMGLIVSENYNLLQGFEKYILPPFSDEIERLGLEINGYRKRIKKISKNTHKLIAYLSTKPQIKQILSVEKGKSKRNYEKIATSNKIPGLVSLVFHGDLSYYYDFLEVAKGPSLGTEFTLAMPYVYLAHYDLLQTDEGRCYLKNNGLDSELLRISVGLEPIEELIEKFEIVFEKMIVGDLSNQSKYNFKNELILEK